MTTYVIRDGRAIEKDLAPPLHESDAAPHLIRDGMDATWHPADGKLYDSKHRFRAATKAAGCIEVGTVPDGFGKKKPQPKLNKRERAEDIKRAIYDLRNGARR